ncbi:MAG: prepilin peptidase [Betaproteobacteria bacterium]|nr:prepilin peptidase [Betaproteobacteria bacterium]
MSFLMDPTISITLSTLFGLIVGSFLNVVIHRLPKIMERDWLNECAELRGEPIQPTERLTLAVPRSHCPHCGHVIRARENIPLISYIILRGRCSACKSRISRRYPLVEAMSGVLAGLIVWKLGASWASVGALLFVWAMIVLTFIDLDTQLLPDSITLPLLWVGLLLNLGGTYTDIRSAVIGAAGGYLALWSVYWAFKLATGKEGMGYGDFKLLAAIGAWFGWQMLPLTILISSMVGAVVGIALIVFARHGRNMPIPFGPYLACAAVIALFWGKTLNQQYLGLL